MDTIYTRTEWLFGEEKVRLLNSANVAVFGIGGVGSYCVEALVRAGVGKLTLVDSDDVSITNINRQLIALHSTIGRSKVDVEKERCVDINPAVKITPLKLFYDETTVNTVDISSFDYVIDAIDCVTSKLLLINQAKAKGVRVISCQGTGNKIHPELLAIDDIKKTSMCPLARVMRRELGKQGINDVKVLFSKEQAKKSLGERIPASCSFVPSVAGLMIAGEVIRDLTGEQ